jgi:hypothetical protein
MDFRCSTDEESCRGTGSGPDCAAERPAAWEPGLGRYHEALNRAHWNSDALTRRLPIHILDRLLPTGAVVMRIDDTVVADGEEARVATGEARPAGQLPVEADEMWYSLILTHRSVA